MVPAVAREYNRTGLLPEVRIARACPPLVSMADSESLPPVVVSVTGVPSMTGRFRLSRTEISIAVDETPSGGMTGKTGFIAMAAGGTESVNEEHVSGNCSHPCFLQ